MTLDSAEPEGDSAASWFSPDPHYPSDGRGLSEVDVAIRTLSQGMHSRLNRSAAYGKRHGKSHGKHSGRGRGRGVLTPAERRRLLTPEGRAKANGLMLSKSRGGKGPGGKGRGRGRRPVRVQTGKKEPAPGDPPPDPSDIGCTPKSKGLQLPWTTRSDLPPLPVAWNDTSTPLPPYQRQRPKRCAILIDRHVHKNGGSTIRDLLLEQERLGHALYQGYTQLYWRSIYQKLKKVVSEVRGQ